jgi:hypothetical protein
MRKAFDWKHYKISVLEEFKVEITVYDVWLSYK